jgi:pimeloyl-ACP methyl ester carboxylesterase
MSKAFLIPGLGADERIYRNIRLDGYEIVHVKWLAPYKSDTLSSYAQALINEYHIKQTDIVVGNSLGGMLAIEIAKKVTPDKTILISSIKTVDEAPRAFKWYRYIPIYRILPAKFYTMTGNIVQFAMGKMSKRHKELFIDMLKKTSPQFVKWAIDAILHWDNQTIPANVYHITGDNDKVFNYKRIKGATIIKGGTHLMILNKANTINDWLKIILQN